VGSAEASNDIPSSQQNETQLVDWISEFGIPLCHLQIIE
jgi:hypothetical protein